MPSTKCFALFRTLLSTVLIRQYVAKENLNLDRDFLTMKCKACFNIRILATFLCKFKELHYKNMSKQERVLIQFLVLSFLKCVNKKILSFVDFFVIRKYHLKN